MTDSSTQPAQIQFEFPEYPYTPHGLENYAPWVAEHGLNAPYGMCQCGQCEEKAPIATCHRIKRGYIRGQPIRFIIGHSYGRSTADRFWEKVEKSDDPDACWIWTGATGGKGREYGRIRIDGKLVKAHRLSWELHFGPIPEHDSYHGMCVLHSCDNGAGGCVNPAHLFLGTNTDNVADKVAKNRQSHSTGAPGEACGASKLTDDIVREIRMRVANGEMQKDIAAEFGVASATISNVVNRKTWRHI